MSSASTNVDNQRPDFWELTNFGPDPIALTGYRFTDSAGLADDVSGEDEAMFGGRIINRDESIVFFRSTVNVCTNAEQFRAWWGEVNLPVTLQIYPYSGRGFSSSSDAVQLWHVYGAGTTLVDRVELYEARNGFSFTYDPTTGYFDSMSQINEGGGFRAVETDDVGSPGYTTGPVPLVIRVQPQDLSVDAGAPAVLTVQATGLPKPRFQWQFNEAPIPGATASTFEISAPVPASAGNYSVKLENGVMEVLSESVSLQVNTVPSRPTIVLAPTDLAVALGQTAVFRVNVRGYPLPTFQWEFNGGEIPGATAATLLVPNADFSSSGTYAVRIRNVIGSTNASATLTVQPKPKLQITEMMGNRSTNSTLSGRSDWWELTNFDTNAVNLRGYRFDDLPRVLEGAVVITNDVTLQPGETMLFIQDMTPEFFKEWWGEENLPENVQFVRYSGNGINAGSSDSMTLWNATPLDRDDWIARAEYSNPVRGVSLTFWCDCDEFGLPSIPGEGGAITAAAAADIGSPGYLTNHPPRTVEPRFLSISRDGQGVRLTWRTQVGKRYELQGKDALDAPNWTSLSQHTAGAAQLTITDATTIGATRRFYRLRIVPHSP